MPDTSRHRDKSSNAPNPSNPAGESSPPQTDETQAPQDPVRQAEATAEPSGTEQRAKEAEPADSRRQPKAGRKERGTSDEAPEARGEDQEEGDEEEPERLTPELIAEEAGRYDAWLAVLVVGFAFALASFQISTDASATLRHIRSGEYLLSHGVLPPEYDYLTFTVAEGSEDARPWTNRSWLFDVAVAGVYKIAGLAGLVVVKAVLAAGIAVLLLSMREPAVAVGEQTVGSRPRSGRSGSPLWWTVICVTLALVAMNRQLHVTPDFVTLLFFTAVLAVLFRFKYREQAGAVGTASQPKGRARSTPAPGPSTTLWWLVPLMAIWVNLDPRFYFGIAAILLFLMGEVLTRVLRGETVFDAAVRRLGLVCGLSLAATLLNPHFIGAWGSIGELYAVQYPGMQMYGLGGREYMSTFGERYWETFRGLSPAGQITPAKLWIGMGWHEIATVFLLFGAVVSFVLNWRRLEPTRLLLFLGISALGMLWVHDLPLAAVVAAVVLGMNGQEWAADSFGREYRVDWYWVLWSRGVRVVTLLGLALLAILGFTGHVRGSWGNDSGYGMAPQLAHMLDEMRAGEDSQAALPPQTLPGGERVFNSIPVVGNYLIWLGRRPYIDDRIALFRGGTGDRDLVGVHRQVRASLRYGLPERAEIVLDDERRELPGWKGELDHFDVNCVVVPLDPAMVHWDFFRASLLRLSLGGWQVTAFGSWGACLVRPDPSHPQWTAYAAERAINFPHMAFREPRDPPGTFRDPGSSDAPPDPNDPSSDLRIIPAVQPTEPTWYYDGLWRRRREVPSAVREAMHMLALSRGVGGSQVTLMPPSEFQYALHLLAIRSAREETIDNPNSPWAYLVLGEAYRRLMELEIHMRLELGAVMLVPDTVGWPYETLLDFRFRGQRAARVNSLYQDAGLYRAALQDHPLRYYQAVTAYNQALRAQPGTPPSPETFALRHQWGQAQLAEQFQQARLALAMLYEQQGHPDAALRHWRAFFASLSPIERAGIDVRARLAPLEEQVAQVRAALAQMREVSPEETGIPEQLEPAMRAGRAFQMGCIDLALGELDELGPGVELPQAAHLMMAQLYLEAGRPDRAEEALRFVSDAELQSSPVARGQLALAQRERLRGLVRLVQGDYLEAELRWRRAITARETASMRALLEGYRDTLLYGTVAQPPDVTARLPFATPFVSPLTFDLPNAARVATQPQDLALFETELGLILLEAGQVEGPAHYPGEEWQTWEVPGEPPVRFDEEAIRRVRGLLEDRGGGSGMMVFRGRIVDAWGDPSEPRPAGEIADVLLTALVGAAVYDGRIGLHEPLSEYLPDLEQDPNRTVGDLAARLGRRDSLADVLAVAGQAPVEEQLRSEILAPIGAEAWSWTRTDADGQTDAAEPRLTISPASLARFGLLFAGEGYWASAQRGENVLARQWIERIAAAASEAPGGEAFGWRSGRSEAGSRWPGAPADALCAISADGTRLLCVIPSRRVVCVHFGDYAFGDEELAELIARVLNCVPPTHDGPSSYFRRALEVAPETDLRLLLRFLLAQISAGQEQVDMYPPSQSVPILFAPDAAGE